MAYILQKDNRYCVLDARSKVGWTLDISLATKFSDIKKAYNLLYMARKKLRGFQVVDFNLNKKSYGKSREKRESFSDLERMAIYNKCKGKCGICGKFVPYDECTIEHIIPLAKGGTNMADNLQCAHRWCNLIKQDFLLRELCIRLIEIVLYQIECHIKGFIKNELKLTRKRKQKNYSTIKRLE